MLEKIDYLPSQVVLHRVPLVGTMGKAEIELAAAFLVRACVVLGDQWQAVRVSELARIAKEDFAACNEPMLSWGKQPFVKPSPQLMVDRAFAEWTVDGTEDALLFTVQGREAMRRWVRVDSNTSAGGLS
jgi:hypothetical protein